MTLLLGASLCVSVAGAAEAAAKKFSAFYALRFQQDVSGFSQCGMLPIPIVTKGAMFKGGVMGQAPDYNQLAKVAVPYIEKAAAGTSHKLVVLDVEDSWSLQPTDTRAVMASKGADYDDLLRFLKTQLAARKSPAKLGYFEVAPPSIYQSPSQPGRPKNPYELAVDAVDKVAKRSDALFPQLYGYHGAEHFTRYTKGTIGTARARWPSKPIYPFIWMQNRVDPAYPGAPFTYQLLPKGAMKVQLDALKAAGADGVVIWGTIGNTQKRLDWDKKAPWWLETKAFLKAQGIDMSKCKL